MFFKRLTMFLAATTLATAVQAGPQTGTQKLFDPSSFENVQVGTEITYSFNRSADEKLPTKAVKDGSITIKRTESESGTDGTVVTINQNGGRRELDRLPADRGNPIFVVFLESSVGSISFATKGSPFYIRNRIKDAFASGGEISEGSMEIDGAETAVTHIDYHPFKGDRNAAKMGVAFENLSMRFTLSDEVPGHYVALTTQAKVEDTVYFIEEVLFETAVEDAD